MPSDPRTFSGTSRSVTLGLKGRGLLRREYSAKQVRWFDVPSGAVGLRRSSGRIALDIRRAWMWSEHGSRRLAERVNREIRSSGDRGGFLQFGSVVALDADLGPHYVLGDMTIRQAQRAKWFAVGRLSTQQLDFALNLQARVFEEAAHIFTLTEWAKASIVDEYNIPASKVTTVYAGPNLNIPLTSTVKRNPRQVLFVGIDWERKGGWQLVEGFRLLRKRLPDAELVIAGCSPPVDVPGVRVAGFLHPGRPDDYRRLVDLYWQSSCFALMSDFEPLGIVMIEAYRAGLPVIAFDSGSRREIVQHGQTGILCRDRDPATIADALYEVLHDNDKRQRMAQAGRNLAEREFTWDRVVQRIVDAAGSVNGDAAISAPAVV